MKKNIKLFVKYLLITFVIIILLFMIYVCKIYFLIKKIDNLGKATISSIDYSHFYFKNEHLMKTKDNDGNLNEIKLTNEDYYVGDENLKVNGEENHITQIEYENAKEDNYMSETYYNFLGNGYEFTSQSNVKINNNSAENLNDQETRDMLTPTILGINGKVTILDSIKMALTFSNRVYSDGEYYVAKTGSTYMYYDKNTGLESKFISYIEDDNEEYMQTVYEYNFDYNENLKEKYENIKNNEIKCDTELNLEDLIKYDYLAPIISVNGVTEDTQADIESNQLVIYLEKYNNPEEVKTLINAIISEKKTNEYDENHDVVYTDNVVKLINLTLDLLDKEDINKEEKIKIKYQLYSKNFENLKDENTINRLINNSILDKK